MCCNQTESHVWIHSFNVLSVGWGCVKEGQMIKQTSCLLYLGCNCVPKYVKDGAFFETS